MSLDKNAYRSRESELSQAYEFRFPDVGEGIHEGELLKWHVKVGDRVKEDQVLAEVETDKAVVEIPAPRSGVILKLNGKPGDKIKVGDVLCEIDDGSKGGAKPTAPAPAQEAQVKAMPDSPVQIARAAPVATSSATGTILATPSTRKLAREMGVDITTVRGSGPSGRITVEDLQREGTQGHVPSAPVAEEGQEVVVKKTAPSISFEKYGQVLKIPFKSIRRAIAENLSRSYHTVVHVTHHDEADVTELVALREKEKGRAEKKGYKLTYLSYVVKAICGALKKHPYVNSSLDEEAETIVLKKYYNIGIAVKTDKGLLVPVLKNADKMSILEIAKEIFSLANKGREGTLSLEEMKGGSFTITNIGGIGGIYFCPIVNHPECAILGTGAVADKVVVRDGKMVVRKIMPLSISFDHRIIDGAKIAEFANTLKELLEDPDYLMVEV